MVAMNLVIVLPVQHFRSSRLDIPSHEAMVEDIPRRGPAGADRQHGWIEQTRPYNHYKRPSIKNVRRVQLLCTAEFTRTLMPSVSSVIFHSSPCDIMCQYSSCILDVFIKTF